MIYSKNFPHKKHFFTKRPILSTDSARVFVLLEAVLLFFIIIQLSFLLNIQYTSNNITFLDKPIELENLIWFFCLVTIFLISYLVIALRDENVSLIHKNFALVLLGSTKAKIQTTTRETIIFVFGEIMFATLLGLSIFLYLDPEVNLIPYPWNYIAFVFFLGLSLLLFSHTKQFRYIVYGPTPIQKRLHHGRIETKRYTNPKTGSIRIGRKK